MTKAKNKSLALVIKRIIDVTGAGFALIIFLPIFIVISLIIRRDGGHAIFKQPRIGKSGRIFPCYKFRSMCVGAEGILAEHAQKSEEWQKFQKLKNDARITKIGEFIRYASVDELPQLLNVLKGDMSFVGPRPILPGQETYYGEDFRYYTSVKPGITGPWQVNGRNKLTFDERVILECDYARNWSIAGDMIILFRTLPAILQGA